MKCFINNLLTQNELTMKKSILLIAVLAAFSFTSCKKNYTCVCKYKGIEASRTTIKDTKKKAKDACTAIKDTYPGNNDVVCEVE